MTQTDRPSLSAEKAYILVPLDGSPRAERALPVARRLALALHRPLLLARIIAPIVYPVASFDTPAPPEVYQEIAYDEVSLAEQYLRDQQQALQRGGVTVETYSGHGPAGNGLLNLCATHPVGLVVMTTHGRTGLLRTALGSVADQLVRSSHIPVLLLRSGNEQNDEAAAHAMEHILMPLDGSPLAESALDVAGALAGTVAHHVTLLQVVSYTIDPADRAAAQTYLQTRAQQLQARLGERDCHVDTALTEGAVPSEKIEQYAQKAGCLVVMATHGRGGLRRLAMGSVADQVLRLSRTPLLIVHTVPHHTA